jgi:peptide deformylase
MNNFTTILQLGDPALRVEARIVDDFISPEFQTLLTTMRNVMQEANGVGIAAPQLGAAWRIVIIASRPTPRYPYAPQMNPIAMINPRFSVLDHALHKDWEGCLSVPGIRALTPRYRTIQVNYQDNLGEFQEMALTDFPARIFQHEFDHLQGLTFLDRVENNRDIYTESEYLKLINS